MNKVNWIRLWLLNELIITPSELSRLIYPQHYISRSYWCFPTKAALSADEDGRIKELNDCLNRGLINIYPRSSLQAVRFAHTVEISTPTKDNQVRLGDTVFLDNSIAVLTLPGHEVWETEFRPNWKRWWCLEHESLGEISSQQVLSMMYAGDEILEELVRWYPTYWGLNSEYGLQQRSCDTYFQYQVAMWKVLPCIKIVEWTAKKAEWLPAEFLNSHNKDKRELQAQIQKHQQSRREEGTRACQILERLSNKWECDQDGNPVLLDG